MDNSLTINDIEIAIKHLVNSIGIKEPIESHPLHQMLNRDEVEMCIKEMARYIGLPVDIKLIYISENPNVKSNIFHSTHMTKINSSGRGSDGIIAQVNIPSSLPMFGSLALNNYPLEIKLTSKILYNDVFISLMAHELSHVLLHAMRHPKRDDEFYTDLTAMILGFSLIIRDGRTSKETSIEGNIKMIQTTKYGYLSDSQFEYAFYKINSILQSMMGEKNIAIRKAKELNELCKRCYNNYHLLKKYIEQIDEHAKINFKTEHLTAIMEMHALDYFSNFNNIFSKGLTFSEQQIMAHQNTTHYNSAVLEKIKSSTEALSKMILIIEEQESNLKKDLKIIENYIPKWKKFVIITRHAKQ